jgi:hypothetical protein
VHGAASKDDPAIVFAVPGEFDPGKLNICPEDFHSGRHDFADMTAGGSELFAKAPILGKASWEFIPAVWEP